MKDAASLLPLVAIALIFWLLIIRPASRQRKKVAELQAALQVGDDIILTSGIFGTIVGLADDHVEVEVAPQLVIQVVRPAIGSVRHETPADEPAATELDEHHEEER